MQPRWVQTALEQSHGAHVADIVLVIAYLGLDRPLEGPRRLAYDLYRKLDARIFRVDGAGSSTARVSLDGVLDGAPWTIADLHAPLADPVRAELERHALDVVLCLDAPEAAYELARFARHGAWFVAHAGADTTTGFRRVVERLAVSPVELVMVPRDGAAPRVMHGGYAPVDERSPSRGEDNDLRKATAYVPACLRQVCESATPLEGPKWAPSVTGTSAPGVAELALGAARLAQRYARDRLERRVRLQQWQLAVTPWPDGSPIAPAAWTRHGGWSAIEPPPDRFWADPMAIERAGRVSVFFEEALFATERGRIVVAELRDGKLGFPEPALEEPFHLSYPFCFEWKGELFMLPETHARREVALYRATSFPHGWTREAVLLEGVAAGDATLELVDGLWWMFVSIAAEGAKNHDELYLFHAERPTGPWKPHRRNPVKSDVRSARPAGRLFRHGSRLLRPAQDCSIRYGRAVSIQEIVRLDSESFEEREVHRIDPEGAVELGIHTLCRAGGFAVLDRLVARPLR